MSDRMSLAQSFLQQTDWAGAALTLLAGDASNRKYYRLSHIAGLESAILMDAPPDKGEDIRPFVRIAQYLTESKLSAPKILASDDAAGFLLLEDLGDDLFARAIPENPQLETALYEAATDVLVALHDQECPNDLAVYDAGTMTDLAALAYEWYAPQSDNLRDQFRAMIGSILETNTSELDVLIQRDYHAENLIWLPDRTGIARVGLLDFQDAMRGHRAYDLVSLLQDARRDVPARIEVDMINRYVAATNADPDGFYTAYCCLGAQRNLRILGVFARLCKRDGKPGYVDLIPRVWAHLQNDLAHPSVAGIREFVQSTLPEPTPTLLETLKNTCPTAPAQ